MVVRMRRALLFRFIGVLLLALGISSMITYYFIGNRMLDNNISNMLNTMHVVDYSFNYDVDLQEQLTKLHEISLDKKTRITIIDIDGNVCADSEAETVKTLQNHLEREEIQKALHRSYGYATRYSETLQENMLYVAALSENSHYIIRMSVPYTSILDYMMTIFPFLVIGVCISFLISMVLTFRFTNTITNPLREISEQMEKTNSNQLDFNFKHYKYEELNVISDTTTKMAEVIGVFNSWEAFEKNSCRIFFSNSS